MFIRTFCLLVILSLLPSCGLLREEPKGPERSNNVQPWNPARAGEGASGPLSTLNTINRR